MTTLRSNLTATAGALALGCSFLFATAPANALGLKDCSDKYSAAKAAGKAGNKTFADFQKSDCGADAKPVVAPAAKPADAKATAKPADTKPATAATTTPAAPAVDKKAADKAAAKAARAEKRKADAAAKAAAKPAATTTAPATAAVFPTAIAEKFKTKKPAKARFATCLEQYRTNKAANANGGLRWIQKGGGYYSQCNKKLKG